MENKVKIEKLNRYTYNLVTPNGKSFGTLEMQDDGYFTFDGVDAWVLREIADRLGEVNSEINTSFEEYFAAKKGL